MIVAQGYDPCQHQQAAYRCIQHKLNGGVDTTFATPTANEEIGRYEHQFPEDVEQKQIGGEEDADDATLQQQHEGHVILDLRLDAERCSDTDDSKQCRECHEQGADAIDAKAVVNTKGGNPREL